MPEAFEKSAAYTRRREQSHPALHHAFRNRKYLLFAFHRARTGDKRNFLSPDNHVPRRESECAERYLPPFASRLTNL